MKLSILFFAPLVCAALFAQGTPADYERARHLDKLYPENLAVNIAGPVVWIGDSSRFWYRRSMAAGHEFALIDARSLKRAPAFDHRAIASSLSAAAGHTYAATKLPFDDFNFTKDETAIQFHAADADWKCTLADSHCEKTGAPADAADAEPTDKPSPDGRWRAVIRNYNIVLQPDGPGASHDAVILTTDGSASDAYTLSSIRWSPDSSISQRCAFSPVISAKSTTLNHRLPASCSRSILRASTRSRATLWTSSAPSYSISRPGSKSQSTMPCFPTRGKWISPAGLRTARHFALVYNQRGHQLMRLIDVDDNTGVTRTLITEESATFIDYKPLRPVMDDSGKTFVGDINNEKELIWASERDGWEHLYRYDVATGKVINQITKGNWPVRGVDYVDKKTGQIWFRASGTYSGQDPYFLHYYRINADGTGLTAFTEANGNHEVVFSASREFYVDTWSRVDLPPISELHRTSDRKLLLEVERGDVTALLRAGWHAPEPFAAKGRDGKTDIWGVIYRPSNFNPKKKYPVVEWIYGGPQGSDVPKSFGAGAPPLAELGFIVVQIDGMGTNNRSRAFHDVTWKNLADGGFPDRILWHKAVAAKYPWYDITRVGVHGGSAGGQHALGALLFHPEFYQVAVSDSGCHDNRMDKIWWNEQWMGWPVGPQYAASSNVENASRLRGKLLLIVGELDDNVDPSSTMQVVSALIKANKNFDLLVVPGGGHAPGGDYSEHRLQDFFVHNLLGVEPPSWNQ